MCKWGDTVTLYIPAHPSWNRHVVNGFKKIEVDRCIAPIIQALNNAGIHTAACCCGHGKGLGNIMLQDGRELMISPDFESTRKYEKLLIDEFNLTLNS